MTAAHKIWMTVCIALLLGCLGMRSQRDQARAELAGFGEQVATATRMAQAHARATETALRDQADDLREALNKETRNAETEKLRLLAGIRAGTQRLSIAAHCPAPAGLAPTDAAAATGAADTTRAELDPATAEALVSIAADGDTAILERNACIAQYNATRTALNEH